MHSKMRMKSTLPSPKMPFQVNRALRDGIETQVTDGLRMAILSGFYKPGDMLPTILDFAHGLGVSIRAPQAALRALTREGLVSPRQRRGTMVVGPRPGVFHGRVLVVLPDYNPVYYNATLETHLCARLTDTGYLATSTVVRPVGKFHGEPEKERFDMRKLEIALQQTTALAILIGSHPLIERVVSDSGTPFVEIGLTRPRLTGRAGFVGLDLAGSLPAIVARLRERKARHLVEVGIRKSDFLDPAALRTACPKLEELVLWPEPDRPITQERFVRLALDTFATRYPRGPTCPTPFSSPTTISRAARFWPSSRQASAPDATCSRCRSPTAASSPSTRIPSTSSSAIPRAMPTPLPTPSSPTSTRARSRRASPLARSLSEGTDAGHPTSATRNWRRRQAIKALLTSKR